MSCTLQLQTKHSLDHSNVLLRLLNDLGGLVRIDFGGRVVGHQTQTLSLAQTTRNFRLDSTRQDRMLPVNASLIPRCVLGRSLSWIPDSSKAAREMLNIA